MTTTVPAPEQVGEQTAKHPARKWRVLGTLAVAGAVGAGVATVAFASFPISGTGSGSASTGSVSFGAPVQRVCNAGPMSPGDGTISPGTPHTPPGNEIQCQFTITYTGSIPAYLGLDVSVASTHGGVPVRTYNGSTPTAAAGLYDSSASGLQVLIKDNQATPTVYMNSNASQSNTSGAGTDLGGTQTAGANPSATDLLVSKSVVTNGSTIEFTVDYYLPKAAINAYQAAASSVTLTVRAVQGTSNNTLPSSCNVGQPCPAGGSFSWS